MRRPLCVVALCLVIIAAVRLETDAPNRVGPGCISEKEPDAADTPVVTGQVYQKDEQSVYIKSAVISYSGFSEQSAAASRQNISCQENIICETNQASEIPLGSIVTFSGIFAPFSEAANPGEFDSAVYYRTLGVGGRLKQATLLSQGEDYWPVREQLYRLKCFFRERLYQIFPEREAAVMNALLLGDKGDLDSELKELYRRNGILHILSISSLHITIIGMSVYRLLRRAGLPVFAAAIAGGILLLLYGCMTGFGVSACRAIGMYLIRMLGVTVGRTYDMLTALGVMAALMVTRNPYYLQNGGFLLSFSCVLGIGVVCPALTPQLSGSAVERGGRLKWLQSFPGKLPWAEKLSGMSGMSQVSKPSRVSGVSWVSKLSRMSKLTGMSESSWVSKLSRGSRQSRKKKLWDKVIQSFYASLSITLTTLPVQLYLYYEAPVYSVFLNLLVIPFVKPMMITGLLALAVPWAEFLSIVPGTVLKAYEYLCSCFDRLPFHTWNPGCPMPWQIVVYYLILLGVLAVRSHVKKRDGREKMCGETERTVSSSGGVGARGGGVSKAGAGKSGAGEAGEKRSKPWIHRKYLSAVITVCALSLAVLLLGIRPPAENSVSFLDVGQGDCIVVQTASGETYLFDCGSSSRSGVGEYVLLPYLKYNGIRTIDAVFVSHPDRDHANGILELLTLSQDNGITIEQLVLPAIEEGERAGQLGELLQAASGAGLDDPVRVAYLSAGDTWECDSAVFLCLHPEAGYSGEDSNAYSQCIFVKFHGNWTLLLTGDVEGRGEEALLEELTERNISNVTVLKVAHHGSRNATSEELLRQARPEIAVISCGEDNSYGHPHSELLDRLFAYTDNVCMTKDSGAISITVDGSKVRIRKFGKSHY